MLRRIYHHRLDQVILLSRVAHEVWPKYRQSDHILIDYVALEVFGQRLR